ncbi:hypothetical protein F5Y16DRAFT_413951 [Xylariaceae sp. FL0255]|nr:hypothetical protein F5Y16DRAFT_413951 [Xylariaceae sp. FL0255]
MYECNAGGGDGANIIFRLDGQIIALTFYPSTGPPQGDVNSGQLHACIEDSIIQCLGEAVRSDAAVYEEIIDEVLESVLDIGKSAFEEVAPVIETVTRPDTQDLHTLLYPPALTFRLQTLGITPNIAPIDPATRGRLGDGQQFPRYSSQKITVVEIFVQDAGDLVSRVLQELESMHKIRKAHTSGHVPMRVPTLLGYIKHPEASVIIGFLREWVLGLPLRNISQIPETVHQLHDIGVIWGDRKTGNIIDDDDDDDDVAWLIDFGGGFTEGWVPEELGGTVEGDEEAIKSIFRFLGVGHRPPKLQ